MQVGTAPAAVAENAITLPLVSAVPRSTVYHPVVPISVALAAVLWKAAVSNRIATVTDKARLQIPRDVEHGEQEAGQRDVLLDLKLSRREGHSGCRERDRDVLRDCARGGEQKAPNVRVGVRLARREIVLAASLFRNAAADRGLRRAVQAAHHRHCGARQRGAVRCLHHHERNVLPCRVFEIHDFMPYDSRRVPTRVGRSMRGGSWPERPPAG